jgi:hypothetical protein
VLWWGLHKLKTSLYTVFNICHCTDYDGEQIAVSRHEFMMRERIMNPQSMQGAAHATEVTSARFFTDEEDGHIVAYTINGFPIPIDVHDDEVGLYAENDSTPVYPVGSNHYHQRPVLPGPGYMGVGGVS